MKANKSIVSNVWVMQLELTYKGDVIEGHAHEFDHQHLLAIGEVDITVDGETTRFTAPQMVFIAKDKVHSMRAVSEYTLGYCIHPIRDGYRVQDIISPDNVPNYSADSFDGSTAFLTDDYKETFDKTFSQQP